MMEVIGRWSHREYLTRLAWLDLQWNEPDRSDHYAMQIARAIRQILNKSTVTLDQQKIPFDLRRQPVEEEESEEQRAARVAAVSQTSKRRWWGVISRGKRRQKPSKRK